MNSRNQASLKIGPSFAELCAKDFFCRSYLPKESLSIAFKKLREALPNSHFDELIVDCRYLEKIFETKLGGSVAQLVTSGFETWPVLRQPITTNHFVAHPVRSEPLASQELIFGLNERIDCNGQVIKPLDMSSLDFIVSKLKMMNVTKVTVNLLFSQINSVHQNQVSEFMKAQGFDVFCSDRMNDSKDEVTAWRTNILNACLSGTFQELLNEIYKATAEMLKPEQIFFLDSVGEKHNKPTNFLSSLAFAWAHSQPTDLPTLHLGLEKWSWVEPQTDNKWKSPWGSIEIPHRKTKNLSIQPSQRLESNFFEDLFLSSDEEGFEPGPMFFGRSQKPLLFDVLLSHFEQLKPDFQNLISSTGQTRYQEALRILLKNTSNSNDLSMSDFEKNLLEKILCLFDIELPQKKYRLNGYFAHAFAPLLKKRNHHVILDK